MINKKLQKQIIFSLLITLIGIFLLPNTAYLSGITPEKIIELTNKERQKRNLPPLTVNQLLTKAAYQKANDIFKSQTFQHNINGRKFSSWIKNTGYEYIYVGENLAIDFITSEGVIDAWLKSPSHRKNILNTEFKEIGVAVVNGKFNNHQTILVVQIFGSPLKIFLSPIQNYINSSNLFTNFPQEKLLTNILYFQKHSFVNTKQTIKHHSTFHLQIINNFSNSYYPLLKFIILLIMPYLIIVFIFSVFNLFFVVNATITKGNFKYQKKQNYV